MKEVIYDKKRITSTVILGIFLLISLFFTIIFLPITWAMVNEAVEASKQSNPDAGAAGQVVGAGAIALVIGVGIVLVFAIEIALAINTPIFLLFSIKNRKSTLKPIRIISYVYDGLFGAMFICAVVKIILLACGI